MFYDLPDPVTGMRIGQVDHLYVSHLHRNMGIAQAMIDMLVEESDAHGWERIRSQRAAPARGRPKTLRKNSHEGGFFQLGNPFRSIHLSELIAA